MPASRFPPYPPARKPKSKKEFMTLVSNVSARKKWLLKYAPEWCGSEIWSETQVKKYIEDVKNGHEPLPFAKKVKIPRAWDWEIIPVFAVAEPVQDHLDIGRVEAFLLQMERYNNFME